MSCGSPKSLPVHSVHSADYFYLLLLQLVLCRVAALKVSPYIPYIAQIIFSVLSFEISEDILRNQKIIIGYSNFLTNV